MFNKSKFNKMGLNIVFGQIDGTPSINIISISEYVISSKTGYDSSEVVFDSEFNIQEWVARATKPDTIPAQGVGDIVGQGDSLILSGQPITFFVDDEELLWGDLNYTVTIYVKVGGVWYG